MNAGFARVDHVVPFPSEWHGSFIEAAVRGTGLKLTVASESGEDVIMRGLSLVNNDACYSALVAAAQAVRAVERTRAEDPEAKEVIEHLALCPGCRARDTPYLIERALAGAGLSNVTVHDALPAAFSGLCALDNTAQAHLAEAVVVGDVLLQLRCRFSPYYQAHERHYLDALITTWRKHALGLLAAKPTLDAKRYLADVDCEARVLLTRPRQGNPQVGVAGSSWAVFCEGINGLLVDVVEGESCEVVLPYFAAQLSYVLHVSGVSCAFLDRIDELCAHLGGLNAIPRCPSYADLKRMGARYVPESLSIGSGWSLAGWMGFLLESGIDNIVYASTFGCMSGHVVGQGVMRDLRTAYPDANIASIEFDPGISGVNQVNRIKLMASIAKRKREEIDHDRKRAGV